MANLNKSFEGTVSAMGTLAASAKDAKDYQAQLQASVKNLSALNQIYDSEIKDANSHLKTMNKFYGNLTSAMTNMTEASKESDAFRKQVSSLTTNLTQLNKVYGNMLTAMKG
jgi:gliding motility-associated protein GldL